MRFELILPKPVRKQLEALDTVVQDRIVQELAALLEQPRKAGVIQLTGETAFRSRVGDYRIVFEVDEVNRALTVLNIGHRSEVYRS